MTESITAAIAKKELPAMEPGAMCYMLVEEGATTAAAPPSLASPSHVFLFRYRPRNLGSESARFPVVGISDPVEHLTQFVIPVERWSTEPKV